MTTDPHAGMGSNTEPSQDTHRLHQESAARASNAARVAVRRAMAATAEADRLAGVVTEAIRTSRSARGWISAGDTVKEFDAAKARTRDAESAAARSDAAAGQTRIAAEAGDTEAAAVAHADALAEAQTAEDAAIAAEVHRDRAAAQASKFSVGAGVSAGVSPSRGGPANTNISRHIQSAPATAPPAPRLVERIIGFRLRKKNAEAEMNKSDDAWRKFGPSHGSSVADGGGGQQQGSGSGKGGRGGRGGREMRGSRRGN